MKKHGVKKMVVGSSAQNSAPNFYEDFFAQMSPPLNFPPMQHDRQKQWQIIHSPLLLFAVERALLSQLEHCFGWLLCRLWQFALSGYHLNMVEFAIIQPDLSFMIAGGHPVVTFRYKQHLYNCIWQCNK